VRKIFSSQSAFLNPRLLLGVAICLTGISLALVVFGQNRWNNARPNSPGPGVIVTGSPDVTPTPTPTPTPSCVPPPPNMVSWWPGDGNPNDIWDGNPGTLVNGATFAAGEVGQAFSFNGNNQYVLIGDPVPASLQIQNEITLDAWIYVTGYPAGNTLGLIVGSQYDVNRAGATIFLDGRTNPDGQTAPPGHIHFQIGDGSFHVANANAQVPLNQWVHIAATRRANEDANIYYNGVLQPSTSVPWSGSISYNGAWFAIGQQKDINRPFNGLIDEVEVLNRALTQAEVQAIVNAGSAGKCKPICAPPPPNMVAWYPGDGNANDISGDNYNGTLVTDPSQRIFVNAMTYRLPLKRSIPTRSSHQAPRLIVP